MIRSVAVPGTTLEVNLATQVGHPFDNATVQKDVRYLWGLGRFQDIRVETRDEPEGTDVVFHVKPAETMRLHAVHINPPTPGLQVNVPEGARINEMSAQQIAAGARKQLVQRGYLYANVTYGFTQRGSEVDLNLDVDTGKAVRVQGVQFTGDLGLSPEELQKTLRALRPTRLLPGIPHVWGGWKLTPSYTEAAADSDAARLESVYLKKGYFDAMVWSREPRMDEKGARVVFEIDAGKPYTVRSWSLEGADGKAVKGISSPDSLCSALFAQRREGEREGILDFSARMNVQSSEDGVADVTASIERGRPYRVGRIEFVGNRHFSDSAIRNNFLLEEGKPFDERLLRRSLARLNQTGWFQNLDVDSVAVLRDEKTGSADVRVRLAERKSGAWNISGPVGPASVAGPLEGSISSRLPSWGRGLFELSTYTVSVSAFAFTSALLPGVAIAPSFIPIFALQRPFTPGQGWLSGFVIAPQIGWRGSAIAYGTAQLQKRLLPLLSGDRGLIPDLPVTVNRPEGEAMMMCVAPKPRLNALRVTAGVALQFAGSMTGF